jgi:type IV secretory pathway VirB4 component
MAKEITTHTTLRDVLAPSALKVESNHVQLGDRYTRTLFVFSYPRFLGSSWFNPVINADRALDIAIYITPEDTATVLRKLRKKTTEVESQLMEHERKGLVRDPILETAHQDLEQLRDRLQTAQERLFRQGLYITLYARSPKELDEAEEEIKGLLEARLVLARPAMFQHDAGFLTTLPTAWDHLAITHPMNSSPLSTTFPFVSADLSSNQGILYGINRHNNSLILFDRFELVNANMLVFGTSGSGKSYFEKLEILRSVMTGTQVYVIDPENEYQYLADTVDGAFIKISLTSSHHINPFDLPPPGEDESPGEIFRSNVSYLVGLLRIMLGGLTPQEDAILDRALIETYASRDITPDADFSKLTPPTLADLKTVLQAMEGTESVVARLEKYTTGTYALFLNQQTNVNVEKPLVVFNIRDLEDELRPIAMYMILHYIWNIIRHELKRRLLVVDEAWLIMKYEDGASFLLNMAKRARKYYLGLTTITQDIADFMKSKHGVPIVTNASLQLLLKQSPATIETVVKTFNLTEAEKLLLLETNVGEGILVAGLKRAAIKVIASYTEDQIITSDPAELIAIKKAKEEFQKAQKK